MTRARDRLVLTRVEQRFGLERYGARVAAAYERAIERRRASVVTW